MKTDVPISIQLGKYRSAAGRCQLKATSDMLSRFKATPRTPRMDAYRASFTFLSLAATA